MGDEKGQYDLAEVRKRLSMAEVCTREGVKFRRVGTWLVALCPFHEESTGSFQIGTERPDRATCRGCGWNGDIFAFWSAKRGVEFAQAVGELASLCGVSPRLEGVKWSRHNGKKVPRVTGARERERKKPDLPRMRALRDGEIEELAMLRGLSVEGVRVAARTFRRVGYCEWPQWFGRDLRWHEGEQVGPAWVCTDDARWCAQFRRMDGRPYQIRRQDDSGKVDDLKGWTKGSPTWPIGAAELGERQCVMLVEGGPDMLAAFHFLWGFEQLDRVGVVAMMGGSPRIAADALQYFAGKRVRIVEHADEEKEVKRKRADGSFSVKHIRPGREAAARWSKQLTEAGAAVQVFQLHGLVTAAGAVVNDLNDLALCSAEVVASDEIVEAFCDWKF